MAELFRNWIHVLNFSLNAQNNLVHQAFSGSWPKFYRYSPYVMSHVGYQKPKLYLDKKAENARGIKEALEEAYTVKGGSFSDLLAMLVECCC